MVSDSQDSKGGTLDEIPFIGNREIVEPTFSRKTGHQMREGGHLIVKTLTHNFVLARRTAGLKMERSWKKRMFSDGPKVESISRGGPKT